MYRKLEMLLEGKEKNHIAPFFWQHGESEEILREYMKVIRSAGCGAVCVESRPHPDFCGPGWWHDMDIILDEAQKRNMKVWILDDSHFPTGYANGALENATEDLCRQSIFSNEVSEKRLNGYISFNVKEYIHPPALRLSTLAELAGKMMSPPRKFQDDSLLSVTAVNMDTDELIDLTEKICENRILWKVPQGNWKIYVNGLSRNCGPHRNYINMMDQKSCRILIDTVYEPHYRHYAKEFGNTIAGFFSDEPELGNGILYMQNNPIGSEQDLPWSAELEEILNKKLGSSWKKEVCLLWDCAVGKNNKKRATEIRYIYMDTVTRKVRDDFSIQIGNWCREHGVKYIGHVIEDEGQHCRTASSLGHYFRGLAGQDMAGIDDIGGQVFPGGEDGPDEGPMGRTRNGEFYHYGLAELAASAAAIEPSKKGRAMCEIFGNYGWKEGVKLEKYLADHFLVRGINYFVPHAFSPKEYPDPDCPPHFYAHGNNPQYRHFGKLIRYMNRVAELFSDGKRIVTAAILYHGESEWCGKCMPFEKVARNLYDCQICSDVIPSDVFEFPSQYRTRLEKNLKVNTQEYQILIIPEAEFVTAAVMNAVKELMEKGFPVVFVNSVPECCNGTCELSEEKCTVVPLEALSDWVKQKNLSEMSITPKNDRIRMMHYQEKETDLFMLVNEGTETYRGTICLPAIGKCCEYNAMENQLEKVSYQKTEDHSTEIKIEIVPGKSRILIFTETENVKEHKAIQISGEQTILNVWKRSVCRSIDYPLFKNVKTIELPDRLAEEQPEFSGFVKYEKEIFIGDCSSQYILEITDAEEGIEVFVNGNSLGIQISPPMLYDITDHVRTGANLITIEVATTLERERSVGVTNIFEKAMMEPPKNGSGITGKVILHKQ